MSHSVRSKSLVASGVAAGVLLATAVATAQVSVPAGFIWQPFAFGFQNVKYVVLDQPGGAYGGFIYAGDLTAGVIDQVTTNGLWTLFSPPGGQYMGVVGIAIDPTGLYNGLMYVAETNGTNLFGVTQAGVPVPITGGLSGSGGIVFDPGLVPGYGNMLYCAQWRTGGPSPDCVMTVSPAGVCTPFTAPGSLADPRYLAFDTTPGLRYGGLLWITEYATGDVRAVTPGGQIMLPLANVAPGVEGVTFGLGDPHFGSDMYTANLLTGMIDMISPTGVVTNFGSIASGAAHILFVPPTSPYAFANQPTMYVADGNTTIYLIAPNPSTSVGEDPIPQGITPATWGRIKGMFL